MNIFKKTDCFWIGRLVDEWPLMRSFIKKNHNKFNKFYYVINYTTDSFSNREFYNDEYFQYPNKIKEDLKDYNFEIIYINTDYSIRDWRDQCFNEFLKRSDAEYIYHLDPDMYIDQSYIDKLSELEQFNFEILCPIWAERIWPFLFCSRKLIDKTTRDFTTRTIKIHLNESLYRETKNLQESCYKRVDLLFDGDHGDKLINELLYLTNFKGWKFYQEENVECIHYGGRTNYHRNLYDLIKNGEDKTQTVNLETRKTILSSQKQIHLNYLDKIKKSNINLFDTYIKECNFFYENYEEL